MCPAAGKASEGLDFWMIQQENRSYGRSHEINQQTDSENTSTILLFAKVSTNYLSNRPLDNNLHVSDC